MVPSHLPLPEARTCLDGSSADLAVVCYSGKKENSHLMAVKMPRVARRTDVGDHDTYSGIGARIIHIPFRIHWVRSVPSVCQQKNRIVVIATKRGVVDDPDKVPSSVD